MKAKRVLLALGILNIIVGSATAEDSKSVPARAPATLQELMTLVIDPASSGVFHVASQAPKIDAEWKTLQGQALTLVEAANTLSSAARAKDKGQWMKDAKALQDASKQAFAAAMARNADALTDLNDPLYAACSNCHEHYLPKR